MSSKKKIVIRIIVVLFIVALFYFFAKSSNKNSSNTSQTPTPTVSLNKNNTTPTPQNKSSIKIIDTKPSDNSINILASTTISFYFNEEVSEENKKLLSVITTPAFNFDFEWANEKTLIIKPKQELELEKDYVIQVNLEETVIYKLRFSTTKYQTEEALQQIQEQIEDDLLFTKAVYDFKLENSWINKFPIEGENYLVVYDASNQKFVIGIYENISQNQRESAINEAIEKIKEAYPQLSENEYYVYE